MKLKTIKDLETNDVECYTGCFDQTKEPIVVVAELRQEAIKRVKSINTAGFSFGLDFEGKVSRFDYTKEKLITLDWVNLGEMIGFIDFFNITQEELK